MNRTARIILLTLVVIGAAIVSVSTVRAAQRIQDLTLLGVSRMLSGSFTVQGGTVYIGSGASLVIQSGATIQAASGSTVLGFGSGGGGGSVAWGDVTGTLSNQTDLQAAFDAKISTSAIGSTVQAYNSALTTFGTNGSAYYLSRSNHSGTQAISTVTGLQTALDLKASLSALASTNGSGINVGGLVHWTQLMGVPAGFADGSDDGSGGGSGTVTSVSVATANGFSGTVANATSTPAITIVAGAITPISVNGVVISGSSTPTLAVTGTTAVSGTNTGDQTSVTGNAGTATALQTARTINGTSFDGTANIAISASNITTGTLPAAQLPAFTGGDATTLAGSGAITFGTVNSNVGTFGNATTVPAITVNAKGLITGVSNVTIAGGSGSGDVTAAATFGTNEAIIVADGTGKGVKFGNSTVTINRTTGEVAAPLLTLGSANVTSGNFTNITGATADGQLFIGNATSGNFTKATLAAGSGISITNGGGNITISSSVTGVNTGDQNLFQNIVISGQPTVTANTTTSNLTFVAGDGITFTTNNTAKSVTVNSTGGSGAEAGDIKFILDSASVPTGWFLPGEYGIPAVTSPDADIKAVFKSYGTVANPTPSTPAGAVTSGTVITFSSATSGAFFTTTNNTTHPTYTVGTVGNTWTISDNQTIEVRGNKAGYVSSAVQSFAYTVAGPSYLIEEDFEGTGTPSGWTIVGYDPDYTTGAMQGSESLRGSSAGGTYTASKTFTAADEVWMYFIWKQTETGRYIGTLRTTANNGIALMQVEASGSYYTFHSGGVSVNTSGSLNWTSGTTVHVWIRAKKGTGSNAEVDWYISSTSTRPGSPTASITTGNWTDQVDRVFLEMSNAGEVMYDRVLVSTTAIGSAP